MKLVINRCYGGFNLSTLALEYIKRTYKIEDTLDIRYEGHSDPRVIEAVEKLGELANGNHSQLEIVEIPDNAYYQIEEYDGYEYVIYSMSEIETI